MNLRINIIANAFSQIYSSVLTIVMVPTYLSWMGIEAYGLIGFFSVLNGWFSLLDLGLTPTLSRQVAAFRGGALHALALRQLISSIESVFLIIMLLGIAGVMLECNYISNSWLHIETLHTDEVENSILWMSLAIGLRWYGGIYRAVITGFEAIVSLAIVSMVLSSMRSIGVLVIMNRYGSSPHIFFIWQAICSIFELILLIIVAKGVLPTLTLPFKWSFLPLKSISGFAASAAISAIIWVAETQLDKLILSTQLSLKNYAAFSLAVLISGSVLLIVQPFYVAVPPRLAKLVSAKMENDLFNLYHLLTQALMITAVAAAFLLVATAESVLFIWTGDRVLAKEIAPVLKIYALGNGIFVLSIPTHWLQFARGDLRLHLFGNLGALLLLVPSIILASLRWGALGAAWTWCIVNTIYFIIWTPYIHSKFAPGQHFQWLFRDILPVMIALLILTGLVTWMLRMENSRTSQFLLLTIYGSCFLFTGICSTSLIRKRLWNLLKSIKSI